MDRNIYPYLACQRVSHKSSHHHARQSLASLVSFAGRDITAQRPRSRAKRVRAPERARQREGVAVQRVVGRNLLHAIGLLRAGSFSIFALRESTASVTTAPEARIAAIVNRRKPSISWIALFALAKIPTPLRRARIAKRNRTFFKMCSQMNKKPGKKARDTHSSALTLTLLPHAAGCQELSSGSNLGVFGRGDAARDDVVGDPAPQTMKQRSLAVSPSPAPASAGEGEKEMLRVVSR